MRADHHSRTRQEQWSAHKEDLSGPREYFPHSIASSNRVHVLPWPGSSTAQLRAFDLELRVLSTHIVSRKSDREVYELRTATSWSIWCANNIDLFSRRYSSRYILFITSHRRVPTAPRTHPMAIIITSTKNLPSLIHLPSAIPNNSTLGSPLLKLRTIFKPLPSRNQRRCSTRRAGRPLCLAQRSGST